jgi:AAA15 family ATPase/GTPase
MKKKITYPVAGEIGGGELGRKFRLKNYKSFKNEIEFYLPKFTLLIGPNNSGKSTLNSWFKLLKTGWKNLDPLSLENKTFNEVLFRGSSNDTIAFTYFLQLNINKEIKVTLYYKNDNSKMSIGGEYLNTGLLDKADTYFDNKPLFEIRSFEDFGPDNGSITIHIKNLIKLIKHKEIIIENDNRGRLLDPFDFNSKSFELNDEIEKLKLLPNVIEINLTNGFFKIFESKRYLLFDLNKASPILNIEFDDNFQLQLFNLLINILSGASQNFSKFSSINKSQAYIKRKDLDPNTSIGIEPKFKRIKEMTGLELRLMTIKDDNGRFYGHDIQFKENDDWVYLNELGDGIKSFINLVINYELLNSDLFNDLKFYFIEEPENTLHPDLIVKLLNLLIEFTKTDLHSRNFIIETHSLIILKYFQLAIAKGILKAEDINIYEFSKGDDLSTDVSRKTIDKHGFLSSDFSNGFTNHVLDMEMELWRIQQSLINKN